MIQQNHVGLQVYALGYDDKVEYHDIYGYVVGRPGYDHRLSTIIKVAEENLHLAQKQWRRRVEAFQKTLTVLDPYNEKYHK